MAIEYSMTAKQVIKILKNEGWIEVRHTKHMHFRHPTKPGIVTIPIHGKKDLPPGTLNSILKQAGLK